MQRREQLEILDGPCVPDDTAGRAYSELARIHRWLGDTGLVVRKIREDPLPVRSVLDVGCATGLVLSDVRRALGVTAVGVDINPRPGVSAPVAIVRADAVRDPLPRADVAFSMYLGHHLSECELAGLVRNVGRSCRRFILLDVVRHPIPLALFRVFVAPFASRLVGTDGRASFLRAYTAPEMLSIARGALAGTGSRVRQSVSVLHARQVLDVRYGDAPEL